MAGTSSVTVVPIVAAAGLTVSVCATVAMPSAVIAIVLRWGTWWRAAVIWSATVACGAAAALPPRGGDFVCGGRWVRGALR